MDFQEYANLIKALLDQQTANEANEALDDFLSDPQSIFFLFEIIDSQNSHEIKEYTISFITMYMKKNFLSLEPEFQGQILDKLIDLTFSEQYQYAILLHTTLCDYVKIDHDRCMSILSVIESCFTDNANVVIAMKVLSEVITNFENQEEQEIIINNHEKFFNYSLEGLQSNDWELIIPSILVFFYTKFVCQTETIEPQFDLIIQLGQNLDFENQKNYFERYWSIIGQSISQKIMPDEKMAEIFNFVTEFASNDEILYSYRIIPLQSLIGVIKLLDSEQCSCILDLVFNVSISYVEQEQNIPIEYFDLISASLTYLPMKEVYMLLKERITHLLSIDDRNAHVVSIGIYSIIFDIAPDAAFSDIDSIVEILHSALEQEDDLLNIAVCTVLSSFQDSFLSIDVFAIHFLPQIIPFIISPNNELRQEANNAMHTICNLITVPVKDFFEALWQIKDQIPDDEFDNYLDYLATAIEKSEDFSDEDTETLREYILPYLNNLDDPNTASNFLQILMTLVTSNENLIESLLPPAINVIMTCFTGEDIGDSSLINCLDFISNFYDIYDDKYNDAFTDAIESVLAILFSDEDEEEEREEDYSMNVKSSALDAGSTIAQALCDEELAKRIQEKCVDFFTHDYENDMDDFDDDEIIEETEYNAIKEGSNASCKIAKLLDVEDARTLFINIYEYIKEAKYSRCAAEAMKPFTKLLHCSIDEDKEVYLKNSTELLNLIINGDLIALNGKDILEDQIDMTLMTNIAYLIAEFVRYQSSFVDELCDFMIQIIKSSLDSTYLYSFIGAYSDVIKFKTGSPEAIQEILDLIPQIVENANDPNTKQNLAYLLSLIVQNDPQSCQNIEPFISILQEWYLQGKESPNGHQIMLSNIASAFLIFMANGLPIDLTLLNEAVSEFPPYDTHETVPMIQNMATIFSSEQVDDSCIETAALSLSKFFLLKEGELKKHKVPPELMETAYQMFVTFSKSNPQIIQSILEKYQNSQNKLERLNEILQDPE